MQKSNNFIEKWDELGEFLVVDRADPRIKPASKVADIMRKIAHFYFFLLLIGESLC